MAIAANLILSGNTYRVLHCDYEFRQNVDRYGRPSSVPEGGFINLTIESTRDVSIIQWMIFSELRNDGEIVFISRESESAMRRVQFGNAFCVYYKEVFDMETENPMTIQFRISCREITIESVELSRSIMWGEASESEPSSSSSSSSGSGDIGSFNPND